MCVIVYKPKGATLKKSDFLDMWSANSDGMGLVVFGSHKTYIDKGFMDRQSAWSAIEQVADRAMIAHFRLATHGRVSPEMTHPFTLDPTKIGEIRGELRPGESLLIHNGMINGLGDNEISDSADLAINILPALSPENRRKLLRTFTGSKFALIDEKISLIGDYHKFNGLWVSNLNFQRVSDNWFNHNGVLDDEETSGWSCFGTKKVYSPYRFPKGNYKKDRKVRGKHNAVGKV